MFEVNDDVTATTRKRQDLGGYDQPGAGGKPVTTAAELDAEPMVALWRRLMAYYQRETDRQWDNRVLMAIDEDFYDNFQWQDTDAAVLEKRGQAQLVYNVISASIDWVTGTEKRSRTDFKVLPRRKTESKPAERKTQLMKYLSDVNRQPFHISRAFEDAVKVGLGWIEDGYEPDSDEESLYARYESWRNILWDSSATNYDLSDARYVFRFKWIDLDVACAMFPDRVGLLERSAADNDAFISLDSYGDEVGDQMEVELNRTGSTRPMDGIGGYQRKRVRMIEAWCRMPGKHPTIRGGSFAGELFDEYSPGHAAELDSGRATKAERTTMKMNVCIMTTVGMLYCGPSPYRHNKFPFTPLWGNKRGRDGLPYGMIRRLKDIQEDVNKRASKAQWILNTNKVIMEEGGLPDDMSMDEFIEENARPDAVLVVKKGFRMELNADKELAQYQLELMSRSISMIQSAAGVNEDNLGRATNAQSGIAIQRRQDQGSMTTVKYFDNLQLAAQIRGEKQLANIEQFVSEPKAFRITNMRGTPEYIEVNDGLPENDITRSKADFIISEAEWRATMRQAAVDQLFEAMSKFPPEVILTMLDLLVENMDLPNVDELVRRIRVVNKQRDPDAEEPSQEEIAAMQEAAELAAIQKQGLIAGVRKQMADAGLSEAKMQQAVAAVTAANVSSQAQAIQVAMQALMAPPIASHVADKVMHESGFVSVTDKEQAAMQAAAQQEAAALAQAQQAQQQQPAANDPGMQAGLGLAPQPQQQAA